MPGKPKPEIEVTECLLRDLLTDQHPDLAELPLTKIDSGWDNEIYRLGRDLVVRIPRRQLAAQLAENEHTWLPVLASRLPISIPAPKRLGKPSEQFPWAWSIVPWFEGQSADEAVVAPTQADRLARFLQALHQPAPSDAPSNPVRGVPLTVQHEKTVARLSRLAAETGLETKALVNVWEVGLSAPESNERLWLHGDLHAQNIIVVDGRISAVIDWGDVCGGDPAIDLSVG